MVAEESTRVRLTTGDAVRLATHGRDVLDRAQFFDTLPAALDQCTAAFAFSARTGRFRLPRQGFEESVRNMAEAARAGTVALVFGTEATGLSPVWAEPACQGIRLPQRGSADSLNVAVAAAVVFYEALRQRSA